MTEYEKLDKVLRVLLQGGSQSSSNRQYKIVAQALMSLAINEPYGGPPMGGDSYSGWPISDLLLRVPTVHRGAVAMEFHQMINPPRNMSFGGSGGASGPSHSHATPFTVSVAGGGGGGGVGAIGQVIPASWSLMEQLAMRMGWDRHRMDLASGFAHVDVFRSHLRSLVHVWIITMDAQSVVLEDDSALYPSDKLITQLRLLGGEAK
jgi:hypothetical protein